MTPPVSATLVDGDIERRRAEGKIANLEALIDVEPLSWDHRDRSYTLGHPWLAGEANAHPHLTIAWFWFTTGSSKISRNYARNSASRSQSLDRN